MISTFMVQRISQITLKCKMIQEVLCNNQGLFLPETALSSY